MGKRNSKDVNPVKNPKHTSGSRRRPLVSNGMKIILFGPLFSRRLGSSLGINLIPPKTCSLNCIYCQLGRTRKTSLKRYPFVSAQEVKDQLGKYLAKHRAPDYLTFSGAGEPTLNSDTGKIIGVIKRISKIPVAVITNATLLTRPEVRRELLAADLVLPSLDAARQKTFEKINRPARGLKIKNIIEGLKIFRKQFKGKIWLEIVLVKNINDSREDLEALKKAVTSLKPDKVQLNTVVRKPAEKSARALTLTELKRAQRFFGGNCEIISGKKDRRKKLMRELSQPEDV